MATRNALFSIFEFQNFTDAHWGKVTKFQFNFFSRLGAVLKKPEGGGIPPQGHVQFLMYAALCSFKVRFTAKTKGLWLSDLDSRQSM